MIQKSILKSMTKTFENFGLHVTVPPEDSELPFGGIIVQFGVDEEERPVALQVLQYTQEITAGLMEKEEEENKAPSNLNIVSFIMTVPVEVKPECVHETLKLLALTNKALPLGSFNYSDVEKAVYYAYNLPLILEAPSEMILLTIIQTVLFAKDTFFTVIEDIATGKETLSTFLELLSEPTAAK